MGKYEQLVAKCHALDAVPTAVAHPCDATSLSGALQARDERLIVPILVGPEAKIRSVAEKEKLDLKGVDGPELAEHRQVVARSAADLEHTRIFRQRSLATNEGGNDLAAGAIPPMALVMLRHRLVDFAFHQRKTH